MKQFVLATILALLISPALSAQNKSQPNIVFILADDLGWADTKLYGHTELYKTPHIERLADRGMTFTHAYSASPLCSPTRSSILTGLHPARTGLTTPNCHLPKVVLQASVPETTSPGQKSVQPLPVTRLDPKFETIAERLKEEGYATGHFGKWHLGKEPYSPLEHGFDVDIPHWAGPGPAGSFVAPWKFPDFDPDTPNQHIEDRMAKEAVEWMTANKAKPFFLNYWMFSVHAPFDAKNELIEKYRPKIDPTDPQRSPTYAAMIESMDDAVGTLLDSLDELKIADNTVIIFFSDNGGNMYNEVDGTTPTSNAPLRGGKASMYEGGVRVPMIVSWPGEIAPESQNDALVQSCDFYPTILNMLGLEPSPDQIFDGVDLTPTFSNQLLEREAIFTYFPHDPPVPDWVPPSVSVHRGDWKLIRLFFQGEDGAHRHLLFNLANDIGETKNLASEKPELLKELDALIDGFLAETKAVLPVPNPDFDPAKYRPEEEGKNRVRSKKPAPKKANGTVGGWTPRSSKAALKDGIMTVKAAGKAPFLGIGAGVSGPGTATFRIRSKNGGDGKIAWVPADKKERTVPFKTSGGEWQDIELKIPAEGNLGIFRIYIPAQKQTVEIDWLELKPDSGNPRRWDFVK
ncbi:MAG: sulfatase [Verrucomicrobiales bacterium]